MTLVTCTIPSPVGPLRLTARGTALTAVHLPTDPEGGDSMNAAGNRTLREAAAQLAAYFAGERTGFDLELGAEGTPFQRLVWEQLVIIPHGTTISYGELARRCGRPHGARAVGTANAKNPIAIIVPCHRVIGADGTLTGYAGGLPMKRWLLEHEGAFFSGSAQTSLGDHFSIRVP